MTALESLRLPPVKTMLTDDVTSYDDPRLNHRRGPP